MHSHGGPIGNFRKTPATANAAKLGRACERAKTASAVLIRLFGNPVGFASGCCGGATITKGGALATAPMDFP